MFLIVPSPNPGASAACTEVCPRQHRHCKTHPYQAEQGAAGVTCQVTASPLLSLTLCAQHRSLSSSTGSISLCSAHRARPSPTAGRLICNERHSRESFNSLLLPAHLLIFLQNWPLWPTFCRDRLLKTTTATKQPKPWRISQEPSRPAQTANGIDKFGKGQTPTVMQAGTRGFFFIKSFTA